MWLLSWAGVIFTSIFVSFSPPPQLGVPRCSQVDSFSIGCFFASHTAHPRKTAHWACCKRSKIGSLTGPGFIWALQPNVWGWRVGPGCPHGWTSCTRSRAAGPMTLDTPADGNGRWWDDDFGHSHSKGEVFSGHPMVIQRSCSKWPWTSRPPLWPSEVPSD